jgi:hypothetical protein
MAKNYLYILCTLWLFISCDTPVEKDSAVILEDESKYEIIDLCDGNYVKLPIEVGFKPLQVKFADSCMYTASESNNIRLLIDFSADTTTKTLEEFIRLKQLTTMATGGGSQFSETKVDFFQDHLTLSYTAESALDSTYSFIKNFYWMVDFQKGEYLTFHFQSRSVHSDFSEILSDKTLMVMNSFIFESKRRKNKKVL